MIGDSLLTPEQRRERNELCERIVLASDMSGKSDSEIAQALFLELPHGHWLLKDVWARHSFQNQLKHQRELSKHENKKFKKAHQ